MNGVLPKIGHRLRTAIAAAAEWTRHLQPQRILVLQEGEEELVDQLTFWEQQQRQQHNPRIPPLSIRVQDTLVYKMAIRVKPAAEVVTSILLLAIPSPPTMNGSATSVTAGWLER